MLIIFLSDRLTLAELFLAEGVVILGGRNVGMIGKQVGKVLGPDQ